MSEVDKKMEGEVVLEMVGGEVKCNKKYLIDHSDYFKAMFEGNFIERNQRVVKLKDVTRRTMNIILLLLKNDPEDLMIQKEEDALSVLQASCMLQFEKTKDICIKRLISILSPNNCVRIWCLAEQLDLTSLCLKTKHMALIHFNCVKDLDIMVDIDLHHLCKYLGHINLQCKNELDVFQVCMKWWRENSENLLSDVENEHLDSFQTEIFMKLLPCLDFKKLSSSDIREMITYPDLSKNNDVKQILQCIISNIKDNKNINYDENIINYANKLYDCRSRCCKQLPCLYTVTLAVKNVSSDDMDLVVPHYAPKKSGSDFIDNKPATFLLYDVKKDMFSELLTLEIGKLLTKDWNLLFYKEFVVVIGEKHYLGCANWTYNTITCSWKRISVMPYIGHHFQTCIVNTTLYIIKNIGTYSKGHMFCYDFEEDKCSKPILLPCEEIETKCCSWNDKLFLINTVEICAYAYDKNEASWSPISISDKNCLVKCFPKIYSTFSNKDSLYIKADNLIELKILDQELVVVNCTPMVSITFNEIKSIVSDDIVYTLYNTGIDHTSSFEKYYLRTGKVDFIFKDVYYPLEDDNTVLIRTPCMLCEAQDYELVADDDFVNEMCK